MTGLSHRAWLGESVRKWLGVAGKAHSTWHVSLKMAWVGRFGRVDRLDWLGGPNGERSVWVYLQLRVGDQNASATIGS